MADNYTIYRHHDLAFFDWLGKLEPSRSGEIASLNQQLFCTYVAYDALSSWMSERIYTLPANTPQITDITYFGTSQGKRLFCAALFHDSKAAVLFEVFPLQLLVLPFGVCNEDGKEYQPGIRFELHLPDDGKQVSHIFTLKNFGAGLMLSEEPIADPLAGPVSSSAQPQRTPTALRIDATLPDLACAQFNKSPVLESLLGA